MGYYANGSGDMTITTQNEGMLDKIADILSEAFDVDDVSEPDGTTVIAIWNDGKYYSELTEETLDKVAAFASENQFQIAKGSIVFFGEDEAVWRFYFDADEKVWKEEGAEIVFISDMSDASDELLKAAVKEYERREKEKNDGCKESI